MRKVGLIIATILLCLSSCQRRVVYSDFYSMPAEGWHQDSILNYDVTVADTISDYNILLVVRHTSQYPYQNLWLFIDEYAGNMLLRRDTVEAMVADDFGRWLGNGVNRYEIPLMYDASYRFMQKENNRITIQQGMRTTWLTGITDVGVEVIKN